jgi:hypothetical protein
MILSVDLTFMALHRVGSGSNKEKAWGHPV